MPFGQHPNPDYTILHISDLHHLAGDERLFGVVDTDRALALSIDGIAREVETADAVVVTGDVADRAQPAAYDRAARQLEPLADRLGAELIWVMGNHDERLPFAERMYGESTLRPQDRVFWVRGLRFIALDSTVPGYHHGILEEGQLAWLAEELAAPAPAGTILALHHPPLPSRVRLMGLIELRDLDSLAAVVRGSDVRGILAGHLHYPTHGTFCGIPVSVASATCYTIDPLAGPRALSGFDAAQSFSVIDVYSDKLVHSDVSPFLSPAVSNYSESFIAELEAMSSAEQDAAFSRKPAENP